METKLNTPLTAEEIDFRVQSINKGGYATILAYKDARVDMKRLDDVFGVEYWQKKYEVINGNLFCSVGIYNKELSQWVWKQDVGTESNTEKQKGEASDAFKRACFNLGIGRELYDYPLVQIKLNANEFEVKDGRVFPTFNFKLKEWSWDSLFNEQNTLIKLQCKDQNNTIRFTWTKGHVQIEPKAEPTPEPKKHVTMTDEQAINILNACASLSILQKTYLTLHPDIQARMVELKDKLKISLTPKTQAA